MCGIDLLQESRSVLAASAPVEKQLLRNIRLLENCAQCSFGHIPAVIRDRGVAMGGRVEPDLMRAAGLPVELEAKLFQPLDDLPVAKTGKPAHVALILIPSLAR